jgi:uncharacterized protein (TIGR02147 family)
MSQVSLFDFKDYKLFIKALWGDSGVRSGVKQKAAQFMGCHTAYLSQVLNKHSDFSIEQAQKLTRFLNLDEEETHFFLLLVQYSRAGTQDLKRYFDMQLEDIKQKRVHLKADLVAKNEISAEDKNKYYETWMPLALHVAVSLPNLKTREALAQHFHLPMKTIQSILKFLTETGVVVENNGVYSVGATSLHLDRDSHLIHRHHTNWRLRALNAIDQNKDTDFHYSAVYSLSRNDAEKIQAKIAQLIRENLKLVEPSKEEVIYCNVVDFFEI